MRWAVSQLAQRFISDPKNRTDKLLKLAKHSNKLMSWGWGLFYGVISEILGLKKAGIDYHVASDLTSQANHLGVTIEADIIKQKLPENNGGFKAINFGKTHDKVYSKLSSDHPIDLTRYQVANNYMGRMGLINSGGASGDNDFQDAVATAVINKRAGGMGLISGRKAFQRPRDEGIKLLNTIQDVYLCNEVGLA